MRAAIVFLKLASIHNSMDKVVLRGKAAQPAAPPKTQVAAENVTIQTLCH